MRIPRNSKIYILASVLVFLLCCISIKGHCGYLDSIPHLKEYEVIPYIDRVVQLNFTHKTFEETKGLLENELTAATKNNNQFNQIAVYIFLGRMLKQKNEITGSIKEYQAALKLVNGKYPYMEPAILHELGDLYYKNDQNALGLENLIKANMLMERIGFAFFPNASEYLYDLGYAYAYYYEDFSSAELYINKALSFPISDPKIETLSYNMLGLVYREMGKFEKSREQFIIAMAKALAQKDTVNIGEISGNIGYNLYKEGKLDSAMLLMQKDYEYSYLKSNWTSACLTKLIMSSIYLKKGKLAEARALIDETKLLVETKRAIITKKAYYVIYATLYLNLTDLNKRSGTAQDVISSQDSLLYYKDKMFFTKDAKEQAAVQIKLITENNEFQLKLIKSEEKRNILFRNTLIILCILIIAIVLLVLHQQKQKTKISENKLIEYTNRLVANNQLIEHFKNEMEQLKNQPGRIELDTDEIFKKLRTRTLLTEEGRNLFKEDFERVYKNFFSNIKEQIPDISPSEMRLLALTKLGLSTKEMAELQGISPDSIIKARYRLKKKIELKAKENSDLGNILKNIN